MLTARRGFGLEEQRLAVPGFAEAVHWVTYAEQQAPRLRDLREVVAYNPPDELTGSARSEFMANRQLARAELATLEAELYPPDEAFE